MSEPSCERAFPLTGKEILLQSVSLLTPVRNRDKHAPPLTHAVPPRFSPRCSAPSLNLLVMMQLIESGESRGKERLGGKRTKRKKRGSVQSPEPQGLPSCGKMCARRLFILLRRAQFPGSAGVKHTRFGADLSPLISLA